MRIRGLMRPFFLLGVLAALTLVLLAACGDDGETAATKSPGGSPAATQAPHATAAKIDISKVPELADGKLLIGSDISYAPIEFIKEGTETPDGMDVDLANAMADALGVKAQFVNSGFDGLIPALQTKEFDAVMSAMTITDKRKLEIDFVPYLNVGTGILVAKGNPKAVKALADLCGLTVSVQVGTIQVDMLNSQNAKCQKAINVVTFDTNPLAVEDLRTGGAEAELADYPVALLDAQKSSGALVQLLSEQADPAPYGIGVRKESIELKSVLEKALKQVKDSGKYADLLKKWNLELTALQ